MPAQEIAGGLLRGRYALDAQIGRGGMGVVWRATDTRLGRRVAIKQVSLPPELSGESKNALQRRVLREARAAARLGDPSAVTVYDVFLEDGTSYIVMELVDAPTLREVVERGSLAPERAAEIGVAILGALEAAHEQGIVHRDVTPNNIMVPPDGPPKLSDFGIATLKGDPTLTATGVLLGSPSFMAPEQAQDDDSGPAADLWALGATLYYAVEGVAPFDHGRPIPTLTAVVHDEPRPARRAGPLETVITALLAKRPEDRPGPAEARRALQAVTRGGGTGVSAPAVWTREASPGPRPHLGARVPRQPVSNLHIAGAVALVAALAGLVVGLVARAGDDSGPARRGGALHRSESPVGNRATTGASTQQPSPGGDATAAPAGGEAITTTSPSEWTAYTDENTGFSISYPPGWTVVSAPSDQDSVDFRDPDSGAYLRVDWTDSPGPSPQRAWLVYEGSFAARHDHYRRVQITPTTFQGFEASLWEFTYSEGGTSLHAVDLGFVTAEHGFALNFQTRAEDWAAMEGLFEDFKATFTPPI